MNGAANLEAYSLRVYGRVQRVGFRRYVLDLAQDLGLIGYAKNLPDGSIEIFVQGERKQLSKFLEMVKQRPPPAIVREVKEKETSINPEIREFKTIYGELADELQEGFGAMQTIFTEYWKEFRDYRQEFRDYRQEFGDFVSRTDENFKLISHKYGEISEKLTVILETLIKESKETREMLNETMKTLKEALEKLSK